MKIANRLDTGLNPNSMVFMGYPYDSNVSLLCLAIKAGQRDVIDVLLAHGASPNPRVMVDDHGRPYDIEAPLVVAAECGEDDVVSKLLRLGAAPNQRHGLASDDYSALAQAVYSNNVSTAYLLLTDGADAGAI